MIETFIRDLRIGLRTIVKEKSFCALAVIVLALGICGVTTMFSVVNAVLLRGFAFPNSERLVNILFIDPTTLTNANGPNGTISAMDYQEVAPKQKSLELTAAYLNGSTVNATIDNRPVRYTGAYVTEDFMRILGVAPILGRDFRAEDNQPGAEKVAIIGYGTWQADFGGSNSAIDRVVRINGKPARIIGVMPQGFAFPQNEQLWIPLWSEFPPKPRSDPQQINPAALGLIRKDVSLDQANAEFSSFAKQFAETYPDSNRNFSAAQIKPLIDTFTPNQLKGTLYTMLGFCVAVLLIGCANVMNMQFARATVRARELAIRSSLGASRWRLVRQMLTESLVLAAIGTAVGIGLAKFSMGWLTAATKALTNPIPSWIVFDIDPTVLTITVTAMVLATIASGFLPAMSASRKKNMDLLRDTGRGNTSRFVAFASRGLVVVQILFTVILLVGASLQVQSILRQQEIDYGYDTNGILSARMGLMDGDYPSNAARKLFYDRIVDAVAASPEYEAVALTNRFRMVFSGNGPVEIEGQTYQPDERRPVANNEQVTGGYFAVTGQKLLAGRTFTSDDVDSRQPIAIVNDAFAKKHFGTTSAVGRRFRSYNGKDRPPAPWRDVVGVVSTVRMQPPFNNPGQDDTGFYVPYYAWVFGPLRQDPQISQFATLIVRPRNGTPESIATSVRRDVQKVDANLPLYFVGTPASQIDGQVAQNRIIATMFTIFGMVAMLLSAVGVYGVMSFAVNQRKTEFGVRMALGADRLSILWMVMRQSSLQLIAGLTAGFGLCLLVVMTVAIRTQIEQTLFRVDLKAPGPYVLVGSLVVLTALIATSVPARRATRVDPMVALRAE
jgi:predicted permease